MKIQWISSTQEKCWQHKEIIQEIKSKDTLVVKEEQAQVVDGFGGCFNELGWIALSTLEEEEREKVMVELFHPEKGAALNFCRIPIGASDYAARWYSHNEYDGDINMEHFSIERDHKYLLPYIKKALQIQPEMKFFASPWSPPTWMKFPKVYNNGRIRMEKEILDAYALYFKCFIEAYEEESIKIDQIHIQNEPFADQKFPSCLWSSEQFRVFIKDHIGPLFEKWGMETEIWLGTLNGPTQMSFTAMGINIDLYDKYVDNILFDEQARNYLSGVGYQWAGQQVVQRTHESFPELKLMQTESECGDGTNTWTYAHYIFNLIKHYFTNGVNSYIYWNMVLEPGGKSTWGWPQNTMITVNPRTKEVIYNPEFYVMKHFSKYVNKGAKRLETEGHYSGSALVFENTDQSIVVVMSNGMDRERVATLQVKGETATFRLEANSFNTFLIK